MAEESLPVFVLACVSCGKTVSGDEDKCPRCGISFEDRKFECPFCSEHTTSANMRCESCGTEFEIFAEEVAETSTIELDSPSQSEPPPKDDAPTFECPSCGKNVGEEDKKCPHCGAVFTE